MNAPSRFELFVLAEGESKLTVEEDTKIPDAATLTINKEDHTLANMLRSQLLLLPYVIFAGYKVPHPLEPRVVIKVQTDGTQTPIQAVNEACRTLIVTLGKIKDRFQNEVLKAQVGREGDDYPSLDGVLGGGGVNSGGGVGGYGGMDGMDSMGGGYAF